MAAHEVFDLGCVHYPNHQIFYSENNGLMSQVLKQVIVLFVLCVMLKQSFAFFPFLVWGV